MAPASNGNNPENGSALTTLTKQSFASSQETRWCPGCGDYAVLATFQEFLPELGIAPERIVFITGIGCAGRFAYYMNTYGMHGIHGRAPAIATGVAVARPDLSVWALGGDGDMFSIGGNHLIHALRRNAPIKIVIFNNEVYGLTKGQASPTSIVGQVTKSTPFGAEDEPFNPIALALGAGASFVARTVDRDREHVAEVLRAAASHPGAAMVEIYTNCPIFNDGVFANLTDKESKAEFQIRLEHGMPIRFGAEAQRGVIERPDGSLAVADIAEVGQEALLVHDAHCENPSRAFALANLAKHVSEPTPIGIFRSVQRPVYGQSRNEQLLALRERPPSGDELQTLLNSGNTWTVE